MPVVALGFSVAPVAGQNFGARLADRVKKTYFIGVSMAAGLMAIWAVACHFGAGAMVRFFSDDAQVIAVGSEYLRIIAWTFVGSGLVFVSSSMFQALGNTLPSLAASLRPGGLLAFQTFVDAPGGRTSEVSPAHLLQPDELHATFEALGLETVSYDEHGERLTARLLARKS